MGKIVSRRVVRSEPLQKFRILNMREFYEKRNNILILRKVGGLGDIFMHRMMFEDFKLFMPDCQVHFACPFQYHAALTDHPFIDRILDSDAVDMNDYVVAYNTTFACGRYEMRLAPYSGLNRSDIWANHCGLKLTRHNMHINMTDDELERGRQLMAKVRDRAGPIVVVTPVSAMEGKNLTEGQLDGVVRGLHERGYCVIGLHNTPIMQFVKRNWPQLDGTSIREWMAVLHEADQVVSVDTAALHCRGGMHKPVIGVFTFADGLAYACHYPKAVIVQRHRRRDPTWTCGPCYNWTSCPKDRTNVRKPCLMELTPKMILDGFDEMVSKFGGV